MSLMDDLRQAASPPPASGFSPGVVYSGRTPSVITTPWLDRELAGPDDYEEVVASMGVPLPPGMTLELVEAKFNSAAWHRDAQDRGEKFTAYTRPMWSYRFKVVAKTDEDADLQTLFREARRATRGRPASKVSALDTFVVSLSDMQIGKTDLRGGTPELVERSERALADVVRRARRIKAGEILLLDPGDSTEGFESSPNADRTSDLQMTEQIRVWRRILWRWTTELAKATDVLKVISVPSNHCRVRRGKARLGPPDDDWGLEVLAQVADMASVNPAAFGHVEFIVPNKFEEFATIPLAGGKILSVVHGHQVNRPEQLMDWAKKQGRGSVGLSDIVVAGHFHHLRVIAYGQDQWLMVCPTMDAGSAWFVNAAGEHSRPGVLTFVVDSDGWRDLVPVWA